MEVIRRTMVEIRISGEQVELLHQVAVMASARMPGWTPESPLRKLREFVDELLQATHRE